MQFQLLKGFHDILPEEVTYWQEVEKTCREVFETYGVKEIRLPILEMAALFKRGIGEATDIVSKEMYSFYDQKGRELCLRPEATSQVVRAYVQNRMDLLEPVSKIYLIGPMFRHERPQKGRFRQFHQIDVEIIGDPGPLSDAEILVLAWNLLSRLGLKDLELLLNSLGCEVCRPLFKERLKGFLEARSDALCADCQRRAVTNPLRVFDCKQTACKEQLADAPNIQEAWCEECKRHLDKVMGFLDMASIPYRLDPTLVRGLDYYTRTAFEIKTKALGAQDAVAGGGRYDKLISLLGGPDKPAIGFAIGMERAIEVLKGSKCLTQKGPKLFIAALGSEARNFAFSLLLDLRGKGVRAEMAYQDTSLKSQMRYATKLGSEFVLIVGDEELKRAALILKEMGSGHQRELKMEELKDVLIGFKDL